MLDKSDTEQKNQYSKNLLSLHQKMLVYLFSAALFIIFLLLAMIFIPYVFRKSSEPSIFLTTVLSGTLGAFFSALWRLYQFKDLPLALIEEKISRGRLAFFVYSMVPAMTGAIAAAVLYLVFAGDLLSGALFPRFGCQLQSPASCTSFNDLIGNFGPVGAANYAKVIVWGFVAGFAERIVPDLLSAFAKSVESKPQNNPNEKPAR